MSKNMTRKGLALGATLALATTGLVATPAFANSLVTSLASGTSFNSVVGYDNELRLSTVMSPGLSGNETTLHYRVSNPSGAALEIGVGRTQSDVVLVTSGDAASGPTRPTDDTGGIWGYQNASSTYSVVDADARAGFQTALTDFVVVPLGVKRGEADDANFITIAAVDATAVQNVTITVTAWLDTAANAANVQDTVEVTGNTVTLNFFDPANVSATTTMLAPVTGATSVQAEITTNPELNGEQLAANFIDVSWTTQGNSNAVLAKNTSSNAAVAPTLGTTTYNGTTKKWTSTAHLAYSLANDAWRGTDSTVTTAIDLSATTAANIVVTSGTLASSVSGKTHGLGASNSGSFAVTIDDLGTGAAGTPAGTAGVSASTDVVARPVTITDATTFGFTPDPTTGFTAGTSKAITGGSAQFWSVGAFSTVQALGVYSARPFIGTTALSAAASSTNSASTASDTRAVVVGSANVEAESNRNASSGVPTVSVRTGTTSVSVTATIFFTDALDLDRVKRVGAGVPVRGELISPTGTFQVNNAGAGVTTTTALTDANGQVTFTVSTTTASSTSNIVTLAISPQSLANNDAGSARFIFDWDDAAFTLYDLNSTTKQPASAAKSQRFINAGGSYRYNFALLDQWGQPAPDASWRLQVVNAGRTVSSDTHSLTNGRVSVTVADGAQGSGSVITSTVNVQRLVAGTWTTQDLPSWDGTGSAPVLGQVDINVAAASTDRITLDVAGQQTLSANYVSAANADFSQPIAEADVVAQDRRLSFVNQPAYSDASRVVVNGRVSNSVTGLAKPGTAVTVSGPSNILFSSGDLDAFGSLTLLADVDGDFTFYAFSNIVQENSVLTLTTANGGSQTLRVTFEPVGPRTGTALTITATPAEPGKTVIFTGRLVDDYGNGVDTEQSGDPAAGIPGAGSSGTAIGTDARLIVTYSGPGLISGSLPVETGADGTFTVRVLLGANDTGTATVTATYGAANGQIASTDRGDDIDIRTTLSVTIGKVAPPVSTTGKVNVGSFNGKLVVYAQNLDGKRISWKVGGNWGKATAVGNTLNRFDRPTPRRGVTVSVNIYVDGVLTLTKSVVTR